jgi:hypothetical protein
MSSRHHQCFTIASSSHHHRIASSSHYQRMRNLFPTLQHLIDDGLLTHTDMRIIEVSSSCRGIFNASLCHHRIIIASHHQAYEYIAKILQKILVHSY